jgi:hypothetical protein
MLTGSGQYLFIHQNLIDAFFELKKTPNSPDSHLLNESKNTKLQDATEKSFIGKQKIHPVPSVFWSFNLGGPCEFFIVAKLFLPHLVFTLLQPNLKIFHIKIKQIQMKWHKYQQTQIPTYKDSSSIYLEFKKQIIFVLLTAFFYNKYPFFFIF